MSDVIKSASSCLPELFTKSTTMTISDSMVYGGLTRSGDSDPLVLYVVSNDNGGYAIVSQDQLLPSIIAYSEDGRYVIDSMAPAFEFLMNYTVENLRFKRDSLRALKDDAIYQQLFSKINNTGTKSDLDNETQGPPPGVEWDRFEFIVDKEWQESTPQVGPLLWTVWNQYYPFNIKMPTYMFNGTEFHMPAGCGATAVAQIMAYHRYPAASPLNGARFLWDQYKSEGGYGAGWSNNAVESVGVLFKEIGLPHNLNMQYSEKGSGSYTEDVPRTFRNFGYKCEGVHTYDLKMLLPRISNRNPAFIRGNNDSVGHAWVVDGTYSILSYRYVYANFYLRNQMVWTMVVDRKELVGVHSNYLHHNLGFGSRNEYWVYAENPNSLDYNQNIRVVYPSK